MDHAPLGPTPCSPSALPLSLRRRDVLRVGSMAISASMLPGIAQARQAGASPAQGRPRSVIYLWMGGGVTHIDSLDPKPTAPEEIRGTLKDIATNLPGVRFAETCPRLARMADQLALVRSFSHDSNDH